MWGGMGWVRERNDPSVQYPCEEADGPAMSQPGWGGGGWGG